MATNPTEPIPNPTVSTERAERITLTREGERELRAKRDALRRHVDVELPRQLRNAREFGEATENDAYLQILAEEAVSTARLQALEHILATATIADGDAGDAGVAMIGSLVTIRVGGETVERRLVGDYEAVGDDAVSASSPVGSAILGRSAGETVAVELPSGAVRDLEIVTVQAVDSEQPLAA
jgi:transcription elongation factor GreA